MIPPPDRQRLLDLARRAVAAHVHGGRGPMPPADLQIPASGVFVTLYHRGELRGCLGTLDPREAVADAVVRLGAEVSHRDPRFEPVHPQELRDLTIDVSVLTEPVRVADVTEIVLGRDGLIIEQHGRKGLLLPQVAPEHGFDRETFLAHTCLKAGLPADAWRMGAAIYRFEAEVFGE
jgi:AmmeMemoRadiSam system protein A